MKLSTVTNTFVSGDRSLWHRLLCHSLIHPISMASKQKLALRIFIAIIFLYFFLLKTFAQPAIGNELLATSNGDASSNIKPPTANFKLPAISIQPSASNSPKYEFRAAWIATVSNIDWPSQKGLPVE